MRRALWALAALLLLVPLAEGALRLYGFGRAIRFRPHPRLGWEMVPGQEAFNIRGRVPVRVNALGFRGPEPAPDTGAPRVLHLGDGVVVGNQTAEDATFPFRCAAALAPRFGGVVTVVGAASGYQLEQYLALLREHGATVAPDAVVIGFCWNDWAPNTLAGPGPPPGDRETAGLPHWWQRTALFDLRIRLENALHRRRQEHGYRAADEPSAAAEAAARAHVLAMLDSLAAVSGRLGARPLLLVLPSQLVDLAPDRYGARADTLRAWAAARGVPRVEPQRGLDPRRSGGLYLDPLHLSPAGHQAVADALAPALDSLLARSASARP